MCLTNMIHLLTQPNAFSVKKDIAKNALKKLNKNS